MLFGCIFCHYVHMAKGTLNTHLNKYVPEMAEARGTPLEEDAHHHVGMIRELRWVERGRLEHKITWELSLDGDERVVLQAFSGLIYHPVEEYAKDDFKCRQFRNVDTAFWRRQIRTTLADYRLQPLATRRWFLGAAVQEALDRALSLSAMRVPVGPSVRIVSRGEKNSQISIGVGRDEKRGNRIDGSFNNVMPKFAAARKKLAPVESAESSDPGSDEDHEIRKTNRQKAVKPPTQRYSMRELSDQAQDEDEDEDPRPAGRKRRPAPAIPESPETPPPQSRKTATGNAKSVSFYSSMSTRGNRGQDKPANTIRSTSVFASPSRGRTRPAYTSIAEWNTPLKSSQVGSSKRTQRPVFADSASDEESDSPEPVAKKFRPRFDDLGDTEHTATPVRGRSSTVVVSPAIEPLLKLTVSVFGCHKPCLRIYPGIQLTDVIERAFADAPKDIKGLSVASGIRGTGIGPVVGWKRVWDEDMWRLVLNAARGCARAPEWRAEVAFLGK